jgi:rhamnosyltransferase
MGHAAVFPDIDATRIAMDSMNSPPRVKVLLASWNGSRWIKPQIDSILAQQGVAVSLAIQDDRSSDDTTELVRREYVRPDGAVELLENEVASGSAGANFRRLFVRADVAGFDYVAFADQDDIWMQDKLARAIAALAASGGAGYSAAVEAFWPDGSKRLLGQAAQARQCDFLFEGAGQGCTFVLPVAWFLKVQEFCRAHADAVSALHYHDWLVYLLIRAWGGQWRFDDRACLHYRQHANNEIGARGSLHALTRRAGMLRNGWFRRQVMGALDLFELAGGAAAGVARMRTLAASPDSPGRRIGLMAFMLKHSRRRFSDRLVLAFSSCAGWL